MRGAPIPTDEQDRLLALRRLGMLYTVANPQLDELVHYTARKLEVPIALVPLVDAERQWVKVRAELQYEELPRATSCCGHAICGNELFEMEAGLKDARFAHDPLAGHGFPRHLQAEASAAMASNRPYTCFCTDAVVVVEPASALSCSRPASVADAMRMPKEMFGDTLRAHKPEFLSPKG